MNLKEKAFTVAEIIVCFAIMALIFTATITNVVRNDNYYKLYWTAFDTLFQAAHNAQAQFSGLLPATDVGSNAAEVCKDEGHHYTKECWSYEYKEEGSTGPGVRLETLWPGGTEHTRAYPDFLYGDPFLNTYDGTGTDTPFCQLLTAQLNTIFSANECKSFISSVNTNLYSSSNVKKKGAEFLKAFASDETKDSNIEEIEPSFVAANGQRFYISSVVTANSMHKAFGEEKQRKSYRFVVVDLNGSAGPNSQFRTHSKLPDLVLFAITANGDVIPLGLPEYMKSYINAIVQYPEFLNKKDPKDPTKFLRNTVLESDTMTLFDAKRHAWGPKAGANDPGIIYSQGYSEDEPMSYSSVFYFNANSCNYCPWWCFGL